MEHALNDTVEENANDVVIDSGGKIREAEAPQPGGGEAGQTGPGAAQTRETKTGEGEPTPSVGDDQTGKDPDGLDDKDRTFTQDEVNRIVGNRSARAEAKARKDADEQIGTLTRQLEETRKIVEGLRRGTGAAPAKAEDGGPLIPDFPKRPDPFDKDFEAKNALYNDQIKARDKAIMDRANWERDQRDAATTSKRESEEATRKAQETAAKAAEGFRGRCKELNIPEKDVAASESVIAEIGLSPYMAGKLLNHAEGPVITLYLGQNIAELQALNAIADPVDAYLHMANNILPKARDAVSRRVSAAANPGHVEKGSSSGKAGNRFLKGMTFE